jgi:ribosomal protein L29
MKKLDVKNKGTEELNKLLAEKQEVIRKFRFGTSGSRIKNVKEGGNAKKDVARILTELNKKA